MMPLRAFLVDDEPPALRRLSIKLEKLDDVVIVGASTSARGSVQHIARLKPDVVFLDISMPGLDGFAVLERLVAPPAVVFVTAHDNHAVRAFDINAVDYLLKPVSPERLEQAVRRVRTALSDNRQPETNYAREGGSASPVRYLTEIWASMNRRQVRISLASLKWVEAERDYLKLHFEDGVAMLRMTLGGLAERLDPDEFIRVHRSVVCRKDAIVGFRRKATGAHVATLSDGNQIPIGRKFSGEVRCLLLRQI